jgi:hypothetical protein
MPARRTRSLYGQCRTNVSRRRSGDPLLAPPVTYACRTGAFAMGVSDDRASCHSVRALSSGLPRRLCAEPARECGTSYALLRTPVYPRRSIRLFRCTRPYRSASVSAAPCQPACAFCGPKFPGYVRLGRTNVPGEVRCCRRQRVRRCSPLPTPDVRGGVLCRPWRVRPAELLPVPTTPLALRIRCCQCTSCPGLPVLLRTSGLGHCWCQCGWLTSAFANTVVGRISHGAAVRD